MATSVIWSSSSYQSFKVNCMLGGCSLCCFTPDADENPGTHASYSMPCSHQQCVCWKTQHAPLCVNHLQWIQRILFIVFNMPLSNGHAGLLCGWRFWLLCKICVAIQLSSSRPGKATSPLKMGPPTVRKAVVQMWITCFPTVLSCFQLAPIYITLGCVFISTILPCQCKF